MKKKISLIALLVGLFFGGIALAGKGATEITVLSGGYVRSTPPGQDATAAYFTLENKGSEPHVIVAVKTPLSPKAELHSTIMEGKDVMKMKPVERLEIGAGQKISFQPGGNHIMLTELPKPLTVGERVRLTLIFEDGSELPVKLLVKDARD